MDKESHFNLNVNKFRSRDLIKELSFSVNLRDYSARAFVKRIVFYARAITVR